MSGKSNSEAINEVYEAAMEKRNAQEKWVKEVDEKIALMEQFAVGILEAFNQQTESNKETQELVAALRSDGVHEIDSHLLNLKTHLLAEVWETLFNAMEDVDRETKMLRNRDYLKALASLELLATMEKGKFRTNFFD